MNVVKLLGRFLIQLIYCIFHEKLSAFHFAIFFLLVTPKWKFLNLSSGLHKKFDYGYLLCITPFSNFVKLRNYLHMIYLKTLEI